MIRFHVSIHDVMPETLDEVDRVNRELTAAGIPPATLLVVPGRRWSGSDIARLRDYAERGHALAGHGWTHCVHRIRDPLHWMHSLLISRRAAEHLTLDALGIQALLRRCRYWFDRHGLPAPDLYVPPAWALGRTKPGHLAGLGFRYVETLSGLYDLDAGSRRRLPVLGFEADTPMREHFLRRFNRVNLQVAKRTGAARLAIHPHDLRLRLAPDLQAIIRRAPQTADVDELMAAPAI